MSEFVVWEFAASQQSFNAFLTSVNQLECCRTNQSKPTPNGSELFTISIEQFGQVVIGQISEGHWAMECHTPMAEVFHWMFRFHDANCLPGNGYRSSCLSGMEVWELGCINSTIADWLQENDEEIIISTSTNELVLARSVTSFSIFVWFQNRYLRFTDRSKSDQPPLNKNRTLLKKLEPCCAQQFHVSSKGS